jgi:hypothetical protein
MNIPDEAVEAAANQLRSQINDFTSPDLLMRKRARMVLRAAMPYLLAPGETFADRMAQRSIDAKMAKHEPAHWGHIEGGYFYGCEACSGLPDGDRQ